MIPSARPPHDHGWIKCSPPFARMRRHRGSGVGSGCETDRRRATPRTGRRREWFARPRGDSTDRIPRRGGSWGGWYPPPSRSERVRRFDLHERTRRLSSLSSGSGRGHGEKSEIIRGVSPIPPPGLARSLIAQGCLIRRGLRFPPPEVDRVLRLRGPEVLSGGEADAELGFLALGVEAP
jgi:hypothetical protein